MHHPSDRRDAMPVHAYKIPKFRTSDQITHGVIHQVGVTHGKTAEQHVRFHISPEQYDAQGNGLNMGRDWPTGAYTSYVGTDGRRELLLDYEVIGYHCKGINYKSIGVVAEGAFHLHPPSEAIIQGVVDECIWHETNLGRRLIWTWHDTIRPGWNCPGKYFPKQEVLERIEAHYTGLDHDDTEPEEPESDNPAEPEENGKDQPTEPEQPYDPATTGGCWQDLAGMALVIGMTLVILSLALISPHL